MNYSSKKNTLPYFLCKVLYLKTLCWVYRYYLFLYLHLFRSEDLKVFGFYLNQCVRDILNIFIYW